MAHEFIIIAARRRRYLIRLSDIQEIVSMMMLTPVDGQSGACRGMANLRGLIVPVFDLSGPTARLAASRFIMICCVADSTFGFIIDEVYDVVHIPQEALTEQPIGGGRTLLLTRLGDEVISVLEPRDALARVS
jgi:purine-binding chemotaxis protein CheW